MTIDLGKWFYATTYGLSGWFRFGRTGYGLAWTKAPLFSTRKNAPKLFGYWWKILKPYK